MRKPARVHTYSRVYALGWLPLLALLALPLVTFPDVTGLQIAAVMLLVVAGYAVIVAAERAERSAPIDVLDARTHRAHLRATVIFSVLSILGCWMVLREQASFLDESAFDNLQERYIALVESSLDSTSTSSTLSTVGNLLRAFFFVAITSFVAYTKGEKSSIKRIALAALLAVALLENFLVNVSRLQFVFYLVLALIAASMTSHPVLRRKWSLAVVASILTAFLLVTTAQRFDSKFGDSSIAAEYVVGFFGVQVQPLGQAVIDHLGFVTFSLSMYLAQGIPELIRLIANNSSPYWLGAHSFFLVVAPILRLFGGQISIDGTPITNQGVWWGLLGDLYLDFGVLLPVAFLIFLYLMTRLAFRFGTGPVYGFALRCLTAGMLLVVPYIGAFNTYCVSYLVILMLALLERRGKRLVRVTGSPTSSRLVEAARGSV